MKIELKYKTQKLKKLCTDNFKKARKTWGDETAEALYALIVLLKASSNLQDVNAMQIYNLHGLKGSRVGEYALDIKGRSNSYRLVFIPLNNEVTKENLVMFYKSISIIRIEEVSKHYE